MVSDSIKAIPLTHTKFADFTKKATADAHKTIKVLTCLSFDNKARVTWEIISTNPDFEKKGAK